LIDFLMRDARVCAPAHTFLCMCHRLKGYRTQNAQYGFGLFSATNASKHFLIG